MLDPAYGSKFYGQLSGSILAPNIKNITPSEARKFKSIWMQKLGLTTAEAADALNHTEDMNRQAYSAPSDEDMKVELGAFWGAVKSTAAQVTIRKASEAPRVDVTTVGHCDEKGDPNPIETEVPIEPNCKNSIRLLVLQTLCVSCR